MATDFFPPRLKQYFVALADCLSHLSVVLSCCLPRFLSWLLSYFHFSAFHLSVRCFLPHLICFFWAFFILLGPFLLVYCLEVTQLSVWDTSVHPHKPLFPGRLEQHSPASGCYCSGPTPSIPLLSMDWCRSCMLVIPAPKLPFRTCWLIILSPMSL